MAGTYVVYPWYRLKPLAGVGGTALSAYPKYALLASSGTAQWHVFGMEWKEHIGWLVPILATAAAVIVWRYRARLIDRPRLRRAVLMLLGTSFFCAVIAGLLGALINKAAPIR
jgi:hypothetical protein